jgi:predicted nucleic acid-binding protein
VATSMSSSTARRHTAGEFCPVPDRHVGSVRILQSELRKAWSDQLAAGVIATCPIVELEFLYSARSLADRLEKRQLMHDLFSWVPMPEGAYERADGVQQMLTEAGAHRSAGPVVLLIAATAERETARSALR